MWPAQVGWRPVGKVWDRVLDHDVMALVLMHEGEYRRWHPAWGASPGGNEDWQEIGGRGADHPLLKPPRLHPFGWPTSDLRMALSGVGSTIVRKSAGQPAAYEARDVFITNLPEVLLFHMHQRTAEQVYQEWQKCEVIIGRRPLQRRWRSCQALKVWRQARFLHHV